MKNTTTYKMAMSDGRSCAYSCSSAGEAIYRALAKFPGQTVTACHSGLTGDEAAEMRKQGTPAMAGQIDYEIPPHKAMSESEAARVRGVEYAE